MKRIIFLLILIITISLLSSCSNTSKKAPKAINGVLDLRNWDFEKDGIVRLDGEWEFYWKQFLSSKDFDTVKNKQFIFVPKPWNDFKWGKEELGYEGYATYRLKILLNKKTKDLGLKFPDQGTAFELYINDSLVGKNGKIGKSRETTEPQYKQLVLLFQKTNDTIVLTCKVSNFDFHFGGIYFAAEIGSSNVNSYSNNKLIFDYIFSSFLMMMVTTLICFFIFRPKEINALYVAVMGLLIIIRTITVSEKIITLLLPDINWELLIKLEGMSWFTVAILIIIFTKRMFPLETNKYVVFIFTTVFTLIDLITLFTPSKINSFFIPVAQLSALTMLLCICYTTIKALIRKKKNAFLLLVGLFGPIGAGFNEVLYYNNIVPLYLSGVVGFFFLLFIQMIILSRMFATAFNKVENFAKELKNEVYERTKQLNDQNIELSALNENLAVKNIQIEAERAKSDSLLLNVLPEQIANRLKQGETPIADHFEEASVVFIDIADFTKLSAKSTPQKMVNLLNDIFSKFDKISAKYGLEKIKTIGDCYMAAAGIPIPRADHAEAIALMALEVMKTMEGYKYSSDDLDSSDESVEIKFRIGLDCGPIVAGVIGEQKFIYDLWGDMVNTASRMETNGIIGKIQCTERFVNQLRIKNEKLKINFEERGEIEIKGKGLMKTYFINEELRMEN